MAFLKWLASCFNRPKRTSAVSQAKPCSADEERRVARKTCAVCGQNVPEGVFECPKCGSGVFNHPKKTLHAEPSMAVPQGNTKAGSDKAKANLFCTNCGAEYYSDFVEAVEAAGVEKFTWRTSVKNPEDVFPRCDFCGGPLKPRNVHRWGIRFHRLG